MEEDVEDAVNEAGLDTKAEDADSESSDTYKDVLVSRLADVFR